MTNSIIPPHLAIKALRDNGYKNAAYALAELMDNSIQHGGKKVELLCLEKEITLATNTVSRINKIAVLDNGEGMDKETLQIALQFGNGTNLKPEQQKGIGKFGMGLPSSSISQAKRVDVWTWQKGIKSAIHSYLDIHEIMNKEMITLPEPQKSELPKIWVKSSKNIGKSGTLVVWSDIDRCLWKTGKTIIDNSELIIGRMYRRFINDKSVEIRMAAFNIATPKKFYIDKFALPNDPMYLMKNTSCPHPNKENKVLQPMFEKFGDDIIYEINHNKKQYEIKLTFSTAKKEAISGFSRNPGHLPHGKHASKNIGVSVVRAGRELQLDDSWAINYDTNERWWGVEIDFPPALDIVFGVTNNKQFANNFTELGKIDVDEWAKEEGLTLQELKSRLLEENDPKSYLIDIASQIDRTIKSMRKMKKTQIQNLKKTRHENDDSGNSPEEKATESTNTRVIEGHIGTSDTQEKEKGESENMDDVKSEIAEESGLGEEFADELTKRLFTKNIKYQFIDVDLESSAFFTVKPKGGKILIKLNINHPAYKNLVEVLDKNINHGDIDELKERLRNASNGLKLLLMAWSRFEDEQIDGKPKTRIQDARSDWGRIAREFFD